MDRQRPMLAAKLQGNQGFIWAFYVATMDLAKKRGVQPIFFPCINLGLQNSVNKGKQVFDLAYPGIISLRAPVETLEDLRDESAVIHK